MNLEVRVQFVWSGCPDHQESQRDPREDFKHFLCVHLSTNFWTDLNVNFWTCVAKPGLIIGLFLKSGTPAWEKRNSNSPYKTFKVKFPSNICFFLIFF